MEKQKQMVLFNLPATHCAICGRPLTDPESVRRGIGPICWSGGDGAEEQHSEPHDFTLFEPLADGVILKRDEVGVWTNVQHHVVVHSPTGFEWGYAGSGPADLALNIVQTLLNERGYTGERVDCYQGWCWDKAWELHQDLKFDIIARVPHEGATIPYELLSNWLTEHLTTEIPF